MRCRIASDAGSVCSECDKRYAESIHDNNLTSKSGRISNLFTFASLDYARGSLETLIIISLPWPTSDGSCAVRCISFWLLVGSDNGIENPCICGQVHG